MQTTSTAEDPPKQVKDHEEQCDCPCLFDADLTPVLTGQTELDTSGKGTSTVQSTGVNITEHRADWRRAEY